MATYGLGNSSPIEDVFNDKVDNVSSFIGTEDREKNYKINNGVPSKSYNLSDEKSQIPVDKLRAYIFDAERNVNGLISEIDLNMSQVNIDAFSSIELENSHTAVWKDILKHNTEVNDLKQPSFICYEEYQFAEKHLCRSCRNLIKEYELTISHSSFGHLIELRKCLNYLLNEIKIIKNISVYYLGDEYRDDSEAQIAKYITDWTKSASHYTKQFAKEVTSIPSSIPESELDQISKKQAAQFQTFFSIKINSITTEIHTLLSLIKRDSVDIAETFYNNYLLPAMNVRSKVIEPIMFDVTTTNIGSSIPTLLKEVHTANNAVVGNVGSISADMLERNNQVYKRFDALLQAIKLKRRYINYLIQLESKGIKRKSLLIFDSTENIEQYRDIFDQTPIDSSKRQDLRSSHGELDDLDGDAHPQYLRKDGGVITGDILISEGIKIAGMDLANHSHNGFDGSSVITADSIDYQSARQLYYESEADKPYGELQLKSINSFVLTGGVPQYEAIFEIYVDDDKIDSYDFEILYKEL